MTTQTAVTVPAPRTALPVLVPTSCGHPASPDSTYLCAADPFDPPHCEACHGVGHCTACDEADRDSEDLDTDWEI